MEPIALPTAAEIEARVAAAYGPTPSDYRESIVASGTLGELKTVTYRSGDDVRYVFDRGPIHSESGTFENERWRQNANGLTIDDVADPGNAVKDPTIDADGVIGNDLLSLFTLGLDYTHGHIYLTPNAATKRAMRKD